MESIKKAYSATVRGGYYLRFSSMNDAKVARTNSRLLVVEEHALMALGLRSALSEMSYDVHTSSGPRAADVVSEAQRFRPEIVLMDIRLGREIGSGIDLIAPLAEVGAQVVMLTAERRRTVLAECLEAGAVGWIAKGASIDEVEWSLERLRSGGSVIGRTSRAALLDELRRERVARRRTQGLFQELSQRELLVLASLVEGLSADEIAQEHFVAVTTVRSQIRSVLQKLSVRSQLAAVAIASAHRELLPQRPQDDFDRRRHYRQVESQPAAVAVGIA